MYNPAKQAQVEQLITQLMYDNNLTTWTWKWDSAVKRWGQCQHDHKRLSFSKPLLLANDIEEARHTILHEIAHALVGPMHGHDAAWRGMCRALGIKPSVYHPKSAVAVAPAAKYVGTCPNGHVSHRYRKTKYMAKGYITCAKCSDKWDMAFAFKWSALV